MSDEKTWETELAKLDAMEAQARQGGGAERLQKQRDMGRLTARERIEYLLDPKSLPPPGIPTKVTACMAAMACTSAPGSANPTSSEAKTISRRTMNLGSSPPSSIRASQYTAASGSLPLILLMKAEMML